MFLPFLFYVKLLTSHNSTNNIFNFDIKIHINDFELY